MEVMTSTPYLLFFLVFKVCIGILWEGGREVVRWRRKAKVKQGRVQGTVRAFLVLKFSLGLEKKSE